MDMVNHVRAAVLVVTGCLLLGCGPGQSVGASSSPQAAPSAQTSATSSVPATSPPKSSVFQPAFLYELPQGWYQSEDFSALFRLLPNGFSNEDFDSGKVDGVTLIAGVGAANVDCTDSMAPGVGRDPKAIATELASRPGLVATKGEAAIGGLPGYVLDLRLAPGWTKECPDPPGPTVPLINSSNYNQRMGGSRLIRLYLLDLTTSSLHLSGTLAIELDDLTGGDHIESLSKIASGITFIP